MQRTCRTCKEEKDIGEFDYDISIGFRAVHCKVCRRAKARARYAASPASFNIQPRKRVLVSCRDCPARWLKRQDSLKAWTGRCRQCVVNAIKDYPHVIDAKRQNGIAVTSRLGGIPNAKHFTAERVRGAANCRWRGGVTPEHVRIRHSEEMKAWRLAVFERDDYTCTICRHHGGDMHADHIQPFALFPELRFTVENGRTLCVACHRKYGATVRNGRIVRQAILSAALAA